MVSFSFGISGSMDLCAMSCAIEKLLFVSDQRNCLP